MSDNFDFNFNVDFDFDNISTSITHYDIKDNEEDFDKIRQPNAVMLKLRNKHLFRRFIGESQLEGLVEWEFEKGASYHFLTAGDIDSFSFLRFILRQQRIDYLIAATWVIAKTDINEFSRYIDNGRIGKIDFYMGEMTINTQYDKYIELMDLVKKCNGRVAIFRNHSKVFVGFGEKFNFVYEGSSNFNTNPRVENIVITLNDELAFFYKEFYDEVKSFLHDFDDWKPMEDLNESK